MADAHEVRPPLYVTKWALGSGNGIEKMTPTKVDQDGYAYLPNLCVSIKIGRDGFYTEAEARTDVRARIKKKVASLQKQIDKLNQLAAAIK